MALIFTIVLAIIFTALQGFEYTTAPFSISDSVYGSSFYMATGFHGFHVFSGVIINVIIFFNVLLGTYEKRKSYEMVEKVGLYWHFVDLVWVFVFTVFYLV